MNERDAERRRILDDMAQSEYKAGLYRFPEPVRSSRKEKLIEITLFSVLWALVLGITIMLLIWG